MVSKWIYKVCPIKHTLYIPNTSLEQYHGLFTSNMLSDWTPMLCARLKSSDNYLTGHRTLKKDTGLEQDTLFLGIFLSTKNLF